MNIYLLRHAIAMDRLTWKKSDAERPLTDEGRKKMMQAAKGMKKAGITFDWILTSPHRRAFDTAQIVANAYKAEKKLRLSRSLMPDGDPKLLMRHLALDFRSWESVLLVGHEPYLSKLISVLIGGTDVNLNFKKGGLCLLTADTLAYEACATLEWLLTPKLLKKLR
jgi:phosphohistidine phosphatase